MSRCCLVATLVAAAAGAAAVAPVRFWDTSLLAQAEPRSAERRRMVDTQLSARDIRSRAVLEAMRRVQRHLFVPPDIQHLAYADMPLPIGSGQTISQPYIVAYMTEALDVSREHSVLEIGTGS